MSGQGGWEAEGGRVPWGRLRTRLLSDSDSTVCCVVPSAPLDSFGMPLSKYKSLGQGVWFFFGERLSSNRIGLLSGGGQTLGSLASLAVISNVPGPDGGACPSWTNWPSPGSQVLLEGGHFHETCDFFLNCPFWRLGP